jgi:hypothetical protein
MGREVMDKRDKALLTFTKCFLPKKVLEMSEDKQLKYVKNWSQDSFTKLPDIKIHNGEVKEKNKAGKWEYI